MSDQKQRSNEIADTTRRFLIALNTGGVAMAFAVSGNLAALKVSPSWVTCPVALFISGLIVIAISLMLAKHKSIRREINPSINYKNIIWANYTYDSISLMLFIAGIIVGLVYLNNIQLPT